MTEKIPIRYCKKSIINYFNHSGSTIFALINLFIYFCIKIKQRYFMLDSKSKISCKAVQQLIPGISQSTASRYITLCRKQLSLKEHEILTVEMFCKYYGIK